MKNYKELGIYDFSDYAEEITGDELFKINGGAEVENSDKGVAGAKPGDTITRNDGTVVTLNQGDIDWAQQQLATYGNQETNNTSTGTQNYSGGSNQTTSETKEPVIQKKNDWTFNPNEPDLDKRYNAKDIGGLHVMTISCDDMENFFNFADYYTMIGQYGLLETTRYHGIALTDKNGNIVHILKDEKSVLNYARYGQGDIKTWFNKKNGDPLTDYEAKIQRNIGIGEMVVGPVVGIAGCEATAGASVQAGIYLMADGAVMITNANDHIKQSPLSFWMELNNPVAGDINGTPVVVDISTPVNNIFPR